LDKQIKKPTLDNPDELISFNPKFASPNIRVNVIPVQNNKKKTAEPTATENNTSSEAHTDRKVIIQATTVKILKTRKTAAFRDVTQEVMAMITMFKAQPPMIKEQIEVLIQRGYMQRDEKNKQMLIYLP